MRGIVCFGIILLGLMMAVDWGLRGGLFAEERSAAQTQEPAAPAPVANASEKPSNVAGDKNDAAKIDFVRDIQPLFVQHCHECHGPKKQESGLRLDEKTAALKGGDYGPLLVVGKAAESRLFTAVSGTNKDFARMPEKREPLAAADINKIRDWIDQGATWPESELANAKAEKTKNHWAFKVPVRPALPAVQLSDWPRNPLDHFVLARLEQEQLRPAPEADKATLIRRLSLDLIGLPPTPAELDSFLNDTSADAYEKQIERLLASPHYGERWGRHWLDAARYADSDGFEKDKPRVMWTYRDYVVNALNRDLPYDQFLIEQLAGDQLPNATQEQRVATGFLRNSMINEEGGVDPEQFRMDAMFDRIDCIGKSVLGLTIQCAQCHNHKFDPISQEEYYRIFAFLNNDHESSAVVYNPAEHDQRRDLFARIGELEKMLREQTPDWAERMVKWEESAKANQPEWIVIRPEVEDISNGGQRYLPQPDGSLLALSYAPTHHAVRMMVTVKDPKITGFRLEMMTDHNLPRGGPGRSFMGTAALTEFKVEATPSDAADKNDADKKDADKKPDDKKNNVKFASATADLNLPETPLLPNFDDRSNRKRVTGPIAMAIDGKDETAWGTDNGPGRRNADRKAVFVLEKTIENAAGTALIIQLVQNHGGWNSDDHMNCNLGRMRLSITSADAPTADPLPSLVRKILARPPQERSDEERQALFSYWRTTILEWQETNAKIDELWKRHPEGTSAQTLTARDEPRPTAILKRGDFLKPTKPVSVGVPSFLHSLPENAPPTRLTFARWIADRRSPTTARVYVNRIWQTYFGTGLVGTSEDFGLQSEAPSHLELLDWLAVEFMDRGWSAKQIHRLICNSAAYRQASRVTPEAYAKDQYNRLLARGPRFRVEGEIVRDISLAASGLLNPQLGGPSVMPPAPAFLFQPPFSYAPFPWNEATGPDRYRRGLYTFRRRSTPYPMLQSFDTPNADTACVRRLRSNTPLQALTSLNETLFIEAAQALAKRTLTEGGTDDAERVRYAYRLCVSRNPSPEEEKVMIDLLAKQRSRIAAGWVNPWQVATGKAEERPQLPAGTTPADLGAFTVVSRVLLNLDETVTKE